MLNRSEFVTDAWYGVLSFYFCDCFICVCAYHFQGGCGYKLHSGISFIFYDRLIMIQTRNALSMFWTSWRYTSQWVGYWYLFHTFLFSQAGVTQRLNNAREAANMAIVHSHEDLAKKLHVSLLAPLILLALSCTVVLELLVGSNPYAFFRA